MAVWQAQGLLDACNLPRAWQDRSGWRILDTDFGDGRAFFTSWQAWADDPRRPALLHYVAITAAAPERATLIRQVAAFPVLARYSTELDRAWFGLLPGFHRIVLHQAQVLLTLCIGPLQTMLREQRFTADSLYLRAGRADSAGSDCDLWCVKALARLCRRGTQLALEPAAPTRRRDLAHAGFVVDAFPSGAMAPDRGTVSTNIASAHYRPHWGPGSSRDQWRTRPQPASSCAVIGAGLAGATVAAALARRGWQVTVLDRATEPAAGASSLPVGLLVPQASRDDNTRSRLSRAGVRATLQLCQSLLREGEDWARSGVLELRRSASSGLPEGWPEQGRQWSDRMALDAGQSAWSRGLPGTTEALWHASAGWIKPARLVQACLAQDGVRFVGTSAVSCIVRDAGAWLLLDPAGTVLARAPQLVVACAGDSVRLLESARSAEGSTTPQSHRLATMHGVDGQVSWARQQDGDAQNFAPFPVNGLGSFVANVPMPGGPAWFAGASYETDPPAAEREAHAHRDNHERLAELLPATGQHLARLFTEAKVTAWRGQRCTTADRLPAVGSLKSGPHPDVWAIAGMGSRGLTYAPLCAEVLAAQIAGEPLPLPASLLRSISASRPRLLHHG